MHTHIYQIKATAKVTLSCNMCLKALVTFSHKAQKCWKENIKWKRREKQVLVLFPLQLIFIIVSLFFFSPFHVVIGFIMKWRSSMLCFHWRSLRLIGHSSVLIITAEHISADPQYPLIACSCVCAHTYCMKAHTHWFQIKRSPQTTWNALSPHS